MGLIKVEYTQRRGRRCRVFFSSVEPLGLPAALAVVEIPLSARRRHIEGALERCAGALLASRIRVLLPHRDFEYAQLFQRDFILPDCRALLRLKSGDIVARAAAGHDRVLLSSPRADRETVRVFRALAGSFRHVALDMPPEELGRLGDLTSDTGLAPEPLGRDRAPDADGALFLAAPKSFVFLPSRCAYLSPDGPGAGILGGREIDRVSFRLPGRLRDSLPDGFDAAVLLSQALEHGRLSPGEVLVL